LSFYQKKINAYNIFGLKPPRKNGNLRYLRIKSKCNIKIKLEEREYEERLRTIFIGELSLILLRVLVTIDGV
jgi:hypothetical protein